MMMMMKKLSIATDKMVQLLFFLFCFVLTKQYCSGYNVILFFSRMGGGGKVFQMPEAGFPNGANQNEKMKKKTTNYL